LFIERGLPWRETPYYVLAQILGGMTGAVVAHLMFGLPAISFSQHARTGAAQDFSEFVATFGLMCVILGLLAAEVQRGSICCRRVHHRRLLVHCLDIVRESGGHDRARS
jgi:glycerol uptake facilitator-like aquaporin